MDHERILSADSHVVEPAEVWSGRIDRRFADRGPRIIHEYDGQKSDFFVAEGIKPFPVAAFAVAGVDPREYRVEMGRGYTGVRPSAWDPVERIKDQERDGVMGEVLYPSLAMQLFQLEDGELRGACFRAYNGWLAEYCSHSPKRLAGIALIALDDPARGAAELERAAKEGLKGAMIWGEPPADRPYADSAYDRFWATAQDLGSPVSLHILTERKSTADRSTGVMTYYPSLHHGVQTSLAGLIFGGVLERFPRLQVVSVENDIGWIPHYLQRMDHSYAKFRYLEKEEVVPNPPSFYFHRQVRATFQDDRVGVVTREYVGLDNLMWASDFPHSDSTWPRSREVIERDFAGVPASEVRKIVADNTASVYGLG
jgi:predicted TIM-barrel fold metal-dependent hydrolase